MKRTLKYYRIIWLRHDLPAGLSVFLVALPLCLGIALASGAPLYAGLLSGIAGGIVVPLISRSPLAVSGPAAGLTTLVAASIISLGDYKLFMLTVIIAGIFQCLLGILKLGKLANYFPSSVIKGMLAAIGIILISKQVPLAMGYDQPDFWTSGFTQLFFSQHFFKSFENFNRHIGNGALIITIISLVILITLQQPFAKKIKMVPAPLIVVIAGILLQLYFAESNSGLSLGPAQLVNIPGNIFNSISFPDFSGFASNPRIWKDGIMIGLLATLETLLCIEAIDKLDKRNRITPVNRELVAQGIGNITCGCIGAIPITAVVVRGAANIDAGGRTKLAALTHGVLLLLAVLLFPKLLNKIPYASLAAILLNTGYNLTKPKLFRSMWKIGWKQLIPFLVTIIVILLTDLLIGVGIGLLVSIYFIIQNNFRADYVITKTRVMGIETLYIRLNTNVTFLNKVNLRNSLDEVSEYSVLTIDGSACNFIDYDILEMLSEYRLKAHDRHIELRLIGIKHVDITSVH